MKRYIANCNYDIGDGLVKKGSLVDFCEHSLEKGFIRPIDEGPAAVNPQGPVLQTSGHISADQDPSNDEDGGDEKGELSPASAKPKSNKSNKKKNGQGKEANA